jgi:sarcosine oxidase subunit gamma
MPEQRPALEAQWTPGPFGAVTDDGPGVRVRQLTDRHIVQLAGWANDFAEVVSSLEALIGWQVAGSFGVAAAQGETTIIWTGPERLWIVTPDPAVLTRLPGAIDAGRAAWTDLSHGRTILRISGSRTRALMAKGLPVDLHPRAFPVNAVAISAIHHMDVLVHRRDTPDGDTFDLYVPRGYSGSFWDWISVAAAEFGCEALA